MAHEEDYQRLRQTVTNLLLRIEENQQIQARFHNFEFQLLNCNHFGELLDKLIDGAAQYFELQAVSLILYDPDYNTATLIEHLGLGDYDRRLQLRHSPDFFHSLYRGAPAVRLGELEALTAARLFPGAPNVGSAALLPLMRGARQIGSLHFASDSKTRYSADKASSFMWHLASTVAICLENCLALEQLQRQGQEDILTRVRNRRSFEEQFAKELERADRQHEPLSCLFVDIDHFKQINDTYGHTCGDRCLRQVAQLINDQLRKTDLLARYGGEEFVMLLPRCAPEEAAIIAERVRLAVAGQPLVLNADTSVPLTVSVGACTWQSEGKRTLSLTNVGQQLLTLADRAMYQAKELGRNRVEVAVFKANAPAAESESDPANTFL